MINSTVFQDGYCYVIPLVPSINHPVVKFRNELRYYPERDMTFYECVQYRRLARSIVTENPYIISCYPQDRVKVWDSKHGFVSPDFNTYGASVNKITMGLLNIQHTIPSEVFDGGEAMKKVEAIIQKNYIQANNFNFTMSLAERDDNISIDDFSPEGM